MTDPVRLEFMDMYEDQLAESLEAKGREVSPEEERALRVAAMVETSIEVRKELDPELTTYLKKLENLRDLKQFLMAEFKPFGMVDRTESARVFAEYMLLCVLDEDEAEVEIDHNMLAHHINTALAEMPKEVRASLLQARHAFEWGVLVDE